MCNGSSDFLGATNKTPQKYGKATLDHTILSGHIFKSQSCFIDLQNDLLKPYINPIKHSRPLS